MHRSAHPFAGRRLLEEGSGRTRQPHCCAANRPRSHSSRWGPIAPIQCLEAPTTLRRGTMTYSRTTDPHACFPATTGARSIFGSARRGRIKSRSQGEGLAHKRVNPGNRSCRGSMLLPSFEFGSTKRQYAMMTNVPAPNHGNRHKAVHRSVGKLVDTGGDPHTIGQEPRRSDARLVLERVNFCLDLGSRHAGSGPARSPGRFAYADGNLLADLPLRSRNCERFAISAS